MSTVITKVIKLILITAIFIVLAGAISIVSTIIFQSHIHPDNWKTTLQDIFLLAIWGCIYLAVVWRIIKNNKPK
jgi:hypothetical protein